MWTTLTRQVSWDKLVVLDYGRERPMYWRKHALVLMGKCVRANMRWNLGQTVPARARDPRPTTGFQIGVASSSKVVIGSVRRARLELIQPDDREWVTVIHSICVDGSYTPPFIIYQGRIHISAWYEESSISP
jgi:hypothetical protein